MERDLFAVLGEPRRPWLAPDALKEKFLSLSAQLHPDHAGTGRGLDPSTAQDRFTSLNAAYNCLRNPKDRVQHLIELETGKRPAQVEQVPPELMDLFFRVGRLCRESDAMAERKAGLDSPLLQLEQFESAQSQIEKLNALQKDLNGRVETLLERLRRLDEEWVRNQGLGRPQSEDIKMELGQISRLLAYFNRWSSQVQERVVQLSM